MSWLSPTCSRSTNLTNTLGDTLTHALQCKNLIIIRNDHFLLFISVEQAERIVLLSSIDDDVNPIMQDVFEKNRTFSLYQTGHTVINEEERTVYTSSYTITVLTKKVIIVPRGVTARVKLTVCVCVSVPAVTAQWLQCDEN